VVLVAVKIPMAQGVLVAVVLADIEQQLLLLLHLALPLLLLLALVVQVVLGMVEQGLTEMTLFSAQLLQLAVAVVLV
jgi:hypothetical protein